MRQGEFDAMAKLVPDSLMDAVAISAEPSKLGAALRQRYEGVFDRVSLYFPIKTTEGDARWQQFTQSFKAAA